VARVWPNGEGAGGQEVRLDEVVVATRNGILDLVFASLSSRPIQSEPPASLDLSGERSTSSIGEMSR
jgi:hypothetical protein